MFKTEDRLDIFIRVIMTIYGFGMLGALFDYFVLGMEHGGITGLYTMWLPVVYFIYNGDIKRLLK